MLEAGNFPENLPGLGLIDPGNQHSVLPSPKTFENCDNLFGSLPLPEDHLRKTEAQRAVMIHRREAEVFGLKILEDAARLLRRQTAFLDLFKYAYQSQSIQTLSLRI